MTGQEGLVVEFGTTTAEPWIVNFRRGYLSLDAVREHPDGKRVLVIAGGDAWFVAPRLHSIEQFERPIDGIRELPGSNDLMVSSQGLAFLRLGASGILWHTRRLSWDGFDQLRIVADALEGQSWTPLGDEWVHFKVDLLSGKSLGGSYSETDPEGWERLNDPEDGVPG
jgi:hypothetical protein